MKRFLIILSFTFVIVTVSAQDTLTFMSYNLLNFPNTGAFRVSSLRVTMQYAKPDVLMCTEVDNNYGVQLVLDSALNVWGTTSYDTATFVDGTDTDNMLFYNSNKITLFSQNQIATALRDISHYKIYSCENVDTVWYDIFVAHLKASQGVTNANDRLLEVTQLTNYIATMPTNTNIIFGGDFNLYGIASEPCWNQMTVTCSQPLHDPINMAGEWHSNAAYKYIHTQATRSATNPGCCGGITGGLDDRFDFMLINSNLRDGLQGAQYLTGTYKAFGNDGGHFNLALVEGLPNSVVPDSVNTALFNMSDHLPVIMKVYTCDVTMGVEENAIEHHLALSFPHDNQMLINVNYAKMEKVLAEIITMNGAVVAKDNFNSVVGNNLFHMHIPILEKGMYILRLTSASGAVVKKFVK